MNAIPTPKYNIGDTVYSVHESHEQIKLPCPDCNGTKKWTTTSPAGNTMDADCPRCTRQHYDELSLYRHVRSYYTKAMTIGSIRIDTHDTVNPVEYMCVETGVGSGSIWYESRLFATKEAADIVGEKKTAELQAQDDAKPESIRHLEMCNAPYFDCVRRMARDEVKADVRRQMADELGDLSYTKHDGPAMGHWRLQAGWSDGVYEVLQVDPTREYSSGVRVCEVRGSDDNNGYSIPLNKALATAVMLRAAPTMLKAIKAAIDGDASGLEAAYAFATTMPELPE